MKGNDEFIVMDLSDRFLTRFGRWSGDSSAAVRFDSYTRAERALKATGVQSGVIIAHYGKEEVREYPYPAPRPAA